MAPHVLYIGGEDHHLRIPAMLALQDQGFRVTAASSGSAEHFDRASIPFRSFRLDRFLNPIADLRTIRELRRLLSDVCPDIAQSFDSKLGVLLPLAGRIFRNIAVIRTINGRGWVYSSASPLALALRPLYRALHRVAAPDVSATIFEITEDQTFFKDNDLLRGGRSVHVPGAGVDVEGFERSLSGSVAPDRLRVELGLGDAPVVICVTRMTRQKGIPSLLEAAAIVQRSRRDIRFLLVGPRQSEGRLAITAAEISRHTPYVVATGPRTDVPALLRLADVFAFPTEYREGVPRVLLEAALAGVPIVTTGIAGCSDVVRDDWNGSIVPLRNPSVMAAKILEIIDHPRPARAMAARAREDVRNGFSLSRVVAQQAALYHELIADPSRQRNDVPRVSVIAPAVTSP